MNEYLHINELKQRFKKVTSNSDLREPKFIQEKDYIELGFVLYNESNYPINFKKRFINIKELENFIDLLEKLKITAQSHKYQVQLIPIGSTECTSFDIYINDNLVPPQSIDYYVEQSIYDARNELRDKIFYGVETNLRETAYLYHQINDAQKNIDRCVDLINALKEFHSTSEQERFIKSQKPVLKTGSILAWNNVYHIDLLQILNISKKYIESREDNNISSRMQCEHELLEEYNKIKFAIESGHNIQTNYFNVIDKLTLEELQIILGFMENLESILQNMKANASSILEYKNTKLSYLQESINNALKEKPRDSIESIKSINIDESNAPERYKLNLRFVAKFPSYASYSQGKFNIQMERNANVFKDIQCQQIEKLTQEERDALIYYKTILYRPINEVISYLRKNNTNLNEATNNPTTFNEIMNIISKNYDEYIERKKQIEKNPIPFPWRQTSNPKSVERLFSIFQNKTPNKKEYTNIVLLSIPLLESALSKIETTEDIIVYRGTTGIDVTHDERLLSTSISLNIAKSFATNEERIEENKRTYFPNIIQLIIPKGSPVIVYTDDLFTDHYEESRTFNEEQQEILIDPKNFTFNMNYVNSNIIADGSVVMRINYQANPKTKELQIKQNKQ